MKAVWIERHGGPEVLRIIDRPMPQAGPDEVVVKVTACALNYLDVWLRRGVPGHTFPLPMIPGSDIAGILPETGEEVVVFPAESCGKCEFCLTGREPLCRHYGILGESRDGGCAEYIKVQKKNVFPKPETLGFEDAASVLLSGLTAYHMVATRASVQKDEWVLITGAAGGVGTMSVQVAKAMGGRVIAVVGSKTKADAMKSLGADEVIIHSEVDFAYAAKEITGRQGISVIVDSVGGEIFEQCIAILRPAGRLVTCGATANGKARLNLRRVFFRALNIMGSTMGSRWEMLSVLALVRDGLVKPVIHSVLPMEEVAQGHRLLEDREVIGKVVIRI